MKKSWSAGDRSRAICERCKSVVETRFEYRTYALSTPRVDVPEVLVAVCSVCDRIAAVPYQSSPKLNEARKDVLPAAALTVDATSHRREPPCPTC